MKSCDAHSNQIKALLDFRGLLTDLNVSKVEKALRLKHIKVCGIPPTDEHSGLCPVCAILKAQEADLLEGEVVKINPNE